MTTIAPSPRKPHDYQRRILLMATGRTPQVVTETLYGIAVRPTASAQPFIPTEIHLVTTAEGAQDARPSLLAPHTSAFHRLCQDYDLRGIAFCADQIRVIQDAAGQPVDDIRTQAEHEACADLITEVVGAMQQALEPPSVCVDLRSGSLRLADDRLIELPGADLAFYAWLARRRLAGAAPVRIPSQDPTRWKPQERALYAGYLAEYEAEAARIDVHDTYKCKLMTPMYGGGVRAGEVDRALPIRTPSIRGQLRFWWRLACGPFASSAGQFRRECALWGGIASTGPTASQVAVKVTCTPVADTQPDSYLVTLSLGPVQSLIEAARRTRDLWCGSWLLSELDAGRESVIAVSRKERAKPQYQTAIRQLGLADGEELDALAFAKRRAGREVVEQFTAFPRIAAESWIGSLTAEQQQRIRDAYRPGDLLPVRLTTEKDEKPGPGPDWWAWDDLLDFRRDQDQCLPHTQLSEGGWFPPAGDRRTHVRIERATQAAESGQLFQTEGLDFSSPGGLEADPDSGLRLLVRCAQPLSASLVHLGGERRLAELRPAAVTLWPRAPSDWFDQTSKAGGLTLTLLTPALFSGGYRPGWLKEQLEGSPPEAPGVRLRLRAAALVRWQPHSGWDLAEQRPRAGRKLVPAGATYWFELIGQPSLEDLELLWLIALITSVGWHWPGQQFLRALRPHVEGGTLEHLVLIGSRDPRGSFSSAVPANRVAVHMQPGDQALVLRLTVRLPEGKLLDGDELAAWPYELAWLERLA